MLRVCASTGTPADALMSRFVMVLLFFGGSVGGVATIGLTFCFHCREIWASSATAKPLEQGYRTYGLLLIFLSVVTVIGHYYSAIFLHWWFVEVNVRFGSFIYVLHLWAIMDLILEVKFLSWFHAYQPRYRARLAKMSSQLAATSVNITELPTWRAMALRGVFGTWLSIMALLILRHVFEYDLMLQMIASSMSLN